MLSTNCSKRSKDPIHSEDRGKIPGRHVWQPSLWRGQADEEVLQCFWHLTFSTFSNCLTLSDLSMCFHALLRKIRNFGKGFWSRTSRAYDPTSRNWRVDTGDMAETEHVIGRQAKMEEGEKLDGSWVVRVEQERSYHIIPPSIASYSMTTASGKLWILLEGNEGV